MSVSAIDDSIRPEAMPCYLETVEDHRQLVGFLTTV
jgi:hypothetical protein